MNLIELLEQSVRQWPQKRALVADHREVTYQDLRVLITRLAQALNQLALPAGSRVGLAFNNSIEYVALTYAAWQQGWVVVPVAPECPADEIQEIRTGMELAALLQSQAGPETLEITPGIFARRFLPAHPVDNHGLNLAFIRFTSGTTSARKGVALAHETIRDRVAAANQAFAITPADTIIWCLPMAHHFLITIVLYLQAGATIVLARHVTAKPFLEAVNQWQGTVLYAAPFHYSLLARDSSSLALSTVRLAVSTTCALPAETAQQFHQRFNRHLVPALGIIELGLVAINQTDPGTRWDSVGRPIPGVEVQIRSADAQGVGEVAVRSPGLCDAYAAPWQDRASILQDGWFITGDLGRLDEAGYLYLLSRKTAVINLAGRKIFPEEVESILNRHPAIKESRVFGRQHAHLGEVVEAELVLYPPATIPTDLSAFCRQHLAAYKIPTRFHVVPELPRTAMTGKLKRTAATS